MNMRLGGESAVAARVILVEPRVDPSLRWDDGLWGDEV